MVVGLNTALSNATSGLMATQYAMGVASQNVSNQGTAGYIREIANVQSNVAGGIGDGVRIGQTSLATDDQLQRVLYAQNADVAGFRATSDSLSAITAMQGTTGAEAGSGASGTLSDQLGNLRSSLLSLSSTPSSPSAQATVISAAQGFVQSVRTLGNLYQSQRQSAQDNIVSTVGDINTNLTTIGSLSAQIMQLKSAGQSTADLENQRFTALSSLSGEIGVSWKVSANGDMSISTTNGTVLPTRDPQNPGRLPVSTWPLTTAPAVVSVSSAAPGTGGPDALPGIALNGQDITASLTGGTLGANVTLRDTTLPTMQAQLDSFAAATANRFNAQGMPLFTTSSGTQAGATAAGLSPAGLTGYAQDMRVSSAYAAQPSQLTGGSPTNTTTLNNVISYTFSNALASGAAQPAAQTTGMGVSGTLSTGYTGAQDILDLATSLTANQASSAAAASSSLSLAQTTQSNIATSFNSRAGVSIDTEMSNIVSLQNAYTANAKVVSTVQSMFSALLSAIGS